LRAAKSIPAHLSKTPPKYIFPPHFNQTRYHRADNNTGSSNLI
jgi:hypothetical protein